MDYRAKGVDFGPFLDRNVGKVGYLINTRGETCTQSMIDNRLASASYETYWNTIRAFASQWIGKVTADCMGVYEMFINGGEWDKPLSSFKYSNVNTGLVYSMAKSEGLPNGLIDALPKDCPYPIAVGYSGHVGFYYQGKVYQSSGHRYGLEITELASTAHNKAWQYWYYLPWLDYTIEPQEETDMLKQGDIGQAVYDYQLGLKTFGFDFGTDGDMHDDAVRNGLTGIFDARLVDITTAFQGTHGLPQTGQADMATYGRLMAEIVNMTGHGTVQQADYEAALRSIDELSGQLTVQIGIAANQSAELARVQAQYDQETQTSAHWAAEATGSQGQLDELTALERRKKEILGL